MSDETTTSPEVIAEATKLGWAPLDQWRGDASKWIDADTFVERGHQMMPILRANNRDLNAKLSANEATLAQLQSDLKAANESTKALIEFQAKEVKRQVDAQVASLKLQRREAVKAGDHDLAADIDEQIDSTRENAPKAPTPAASTPPPPAPPAWAAEFAGENEWLGKDIRRTKLFEGICTELHQTRGLSARALLDAGKEEMDKYLSPTGAPAKGTEGGQGGAGGGGTRSGGGGKGYSALPSEAKAQCDIDESKFVGPKKAFKTQAEWRTHYASVYLSE